MCRACNDIRGDGLMRIHDALLAHYGPQGWWPADSATETVIGCILVQHTSWRQTELAIAALRERELLDFKALAGLDRTALAEVIRPAGTPRVKARRLAAFASWLGAAFDFDLWAALERPVDALRRELLKIHGIGPETADCILLYAAGRAVFVVDAYTRRILRRHHLANPAWSYARLQGLLESNLAADAALFNEFHALLVAVGKQHCRPAARCAGCPLEHLAHDESL